MTTYMWGDLHTNVLRFVEYFRENEKLCVVVEDCNLGKLGSLIEKKGSDFFEETEVRQFVVYLVTKYDAKSSSEFLVDRRCSGFLKC